MERPSPKTQGSAAPLLWPGPRVAMHVGEATLGAKALGAVGRQQGALPQENRGPPEDKEMLASGGATQVHPFVS